MKKLNIFIFCLFIGSLATAQDFVMKKKLADRYYDRYDFYKAIPMYEQLLKAYPNNFAVYEKLADSYRRINDSPNAERCYARLMDSSNIAPDNKLYYAQALARNGKYKQSAEWYSKYAMAKPDDSRGESFAKAYASIKQFSRDSAAYIIRKAGFNSEKSDFSPMYYHDGVVFSTAREPSGFIKVWYNWTVSSYLNLYFAKNDEVIPFSSTINTKFHEGPVSFTPSQDTIIFTRSNYQNLHLGKSTEGINKLKLYQGIWDKSTQTWGHLTPLPFNSNQYSVGHPAFADRGKTLYFCSDMPGGQGGTDIYVSHWVNELTGQGKWSDPQNLGTMVNSPGNEMFPFIDENGKLWYASNGKPGLGGLDIFEAMATPNGFSEPKNAGIPINSRFDDFGYISKNGGRDGMFSSDRSAELGNDDIYSFTINRIGIRVLVRDSTTNQPLEKSMVQLVEGNSNSPEKFETDGNGVIEIPLEFEKDYSLKASKEKFRPQVKTITTKGAKTSLLSADFNLNPEKTVSIFGNIADKKSGEKLKDVLINIIDTVTSKMVLDTTTSDEGNFRKALSSVKINDQLGYRVILNKKGYLSKSFSIKLVVTNMEINLNDFMEVSLDKIDVGTDIGKLLNIKPIYFDLGKFNIRPDAATELDKVVKAMKENPGLVIELGSHTDARGSDVSNMTLSDKRAKASANYIISKGIESSRIYGKGYGESQLLNKCANGINCTEEEHALNRRTEFKIVKF